MPGLAVGFSCMPLCFGKQAGRTIRLQAHKRQLKRALWRVGPGDLLRTVQEMAELGFTSPILTPKRSNASGIIVVFIVNI